MRVQPSSFDRRSSHGHASPTKVLLAAALLAAFAVSVAAQRQFDELVGRGWPVDADSSQAVASGDVDGDGDPDFVFGTAAGQNRLYLNDGTGRFHDASAARMPVDRDNTVTVALGDVDRDGDLDIVFGNFGEQNRLYLNDGAGAFSDAAARMPIDSDGTKAMALADVDGDGDLDLFFAATGQSRLYLNDGTGTYTDVTAARLPADSDITFGMASGDVDGDSDVDIVLGNLQGQNRLYLNDGTGTFTDATAGRLPVDRDLTATVALGDVDVDGDLDVVFGDIAGLNRLYLNDGTGHYAAVARLPAQSDSTRAAAMGDVDGDGDLDVVIGNAPGPNRLYLNDGTGTFIDATAGRLPAAGAVAVALADVDSDGDLDVVFGAVGQSRLYLNDGTGTYIDVSAPRLPYGDHETRAVALGDVDGDGDLDIVFGNDVAQNRLYLNGGTGTFSDATMAAMPLVKDRTLAAALGDVDGDGDLDIVFANHQSRNRLYLNDGTGTYTDIAARLPIDIDHTVAVALGDVDGDGDLDIVFGNYFAQNRVYINDGTGTYADGTAARMPSESDGNWGVALGDVDGDGDLDLVVGNYPDQDRLYLNDGTGRFAISVAGLPVDGDFTRAVALGDVDGDGDLDIVFGKGGQNRLYLNDGSGIYTAAPLPRGSALAVALDDVDADGDLDIVCGNSGQNRLYLNDGTGTFADATAARMPVALDDTQAVALGDVDGDGDLDMVCGQGFPGSWRPNRLYLNLLRQLDTPFLSRTGGTYTLEAYARHGAPSAVDVVLPVLSAGTASIAMPPFGTFRLDPGQLSVLPPFLIPQPAGVASVSATIPNVPSLRGTSVYAQALILPYPWSPRLTNLAADVIVR